MAAPDLHFILDFIKDGLQPFYDIERDMYVVTKPRNQWRFENDAEHSWSLGMLACALAPEVDPDLDIGLVAQFALVHDFTELYAGDTSVWASKEDLAYKEERETAALHKIEQKFRHFPWLTERLAQYERQDTPEARYVRSIDKLIALCSRYLDGGAFYQDNKMTYEQFTAALETHRKKAHGHTGAAQLYEAIRTLYDESPEQFHQA